MWPEHRQLLLLSCFLLAIPATMHAEPAPTAMSEEASQSASVNTVGSPSLPRWEWGVGIAAAHLRDYPGSDHYGTYALPLPWFIWRSDRIEVGRDGGRSVLFRSPHVGVDFTLTANPPSNNGDNPERAGMQPLDAVLEPGMRVRWRQSLDEHGRWRFGAHLPVRYAIAVDDRLHTRALGAHAEPGLSLDNILSPTWSWGTSISFGFAENGYTDYYYGVSLAEATTARPFYQAQGGYTGWLAGLRLAWRRNNLSAGLFARFESLADATFRDSPLVSSEHGLTLGLSGSWRLGRSQQTVNNDAQ